MVVSRTKGQPALHQYPANTAKTPRGLWQSLLTSVFLRLGKVLAFRCFRILIGLPERSQDGIKRRAPYLDAFSLRNRGKQWERHGFQNFTDSRVQ
ncbi:hypothetical protein WN48_10976 [Eufriesea mexicana]|uniref:Uncharacterized protein n=1 Tax=Eufriesea mexicana TaxID=516756 RepID=A0A310SIB7_9HYME|nr:hypothetical protein WN48_10976 [Eufriesea mexicana]